MFAEDHTSVRQAYISVLVKEPNFRIIGEAGNGREMLKLMRRAVPDVVVTDIEMPEMNGVELAGHIRHEFPDVKIILLSMHYSETFAAHIISNGANAFLPKECSMEALIQAINTVHRNGYFFDPRISRFVLSNLLTEKRFRTIIQQLSLTQREHEVLQMICEGKTNREIADQLHIRPATVDFHRQKIYSKTGSGNVVQLVKYAIKNGLIDPY